MIRRVVLKDEDQGLFYDRLGLVLIELPRLTKTVEPLDTPLEKRLYFLKHAGELDAMPTLFNYW